MQARLVDGSTLGRHRLRQRPLDLPVWQHAGADVRRGWVRGVSPARCGQRHGCRAVLWSAT